MRVSIHRVLGAFLCIGLVAGLGCNKSSTNASSASSMTAMASQTLMQQMGGMEGANKLADSFAANLSKQPSVTKFLNPDAITGVKNGLVNEIAKASGMAAPNPGADLKSALMGKGLDASAMSSIESSLASAADAVKVPAASKASLMGLMDPVTKSVLGQ
ncbi:MAG: hypothetical protein ACRENN_01640 [Candidatus Eiseniibacteriota bacterium]